MAGSPLSAPRELRFRWYLQVEKHNRPVPEVCQIFGISKKTYYKWFRKDHPPENHSYHSRKTHPNLKLTPNIKLLIYKTKLKYNYGPNKMRLFLADCGIKVSGTIIYRYYKSRRLIRKPQKKQPWYTPMKEPYKALKPGENVQYDAKYVPALDGTWNYQFRLVDTVTDMQYAEDCLDKSSLAAVHVFKQAQKHFPFLITGVQTDNGSEFRGEFANYLNSLNITHRFIPKRSAPWNGKVERANRSIDDEYYLNPYRPWKTIKAYTNWYNYGRYHEGKILTGKTPFEKFKLLTESVTLEC